MKGEGNYIIKTTPFATDQVSFKGSNVLKDEILALILGILHIQLHVTQYIINRPAAWMVLVPFSVKCLIFY